MTFDDWFDEAVASGSAGLSLHRDLAQRVWVVAMEQQQAEVEAFRNSLQKTQETSEEYAALARELRAEVERLRDALEWVVDHDQGKLRNGGDPEWFADNAPIIARKALGA